MRFFKWLHPGLHIKRWLFLFGLGMMATSFGLVLTFNYQWLGLVEEWMFFLCARWGHVLIKTAAYPGFSVPPSILPHFSSLKRGNFLKKVNFINGSSYGILWEACPLLP